jgi:predicted aspartyl protease
MPPLVLRVCVLSLVLTTSLADQSQAATPPKPTLWEHNGSTVYLMARSSSREFYYKQPREGMIEVGARPGSLLFRGRTANGRYFGTAFIFDRQCGQFPYPVSGPIVDNYQRVVLTGEAPRVGANCQIEGYWNDTLEFTVLEPRAFPPAPKPSTGASISVPLQNKGGTYVVPVLINGAITLDFVVDSGATDVSIPADVVMTLFRTGTLESPDFIGSKTYRLADGSTVPSATFRIRFLTVGNVKIEDVTAGVAPVEGSLLLGQSFLTRFKSWSIDNVRQALVLEPQPQQKPPQVHVVVVQDLHLRLQPDPRAPDVLDYRMPQGSQVTIIDDCRVWTGSGRGAQDADNVWCPVTYGSYRGWANALYLAFSDGRRKACVMYPMAQGCESLVGESGGALETKDIGK